MKRAKIGSVIEICGVDGSDKEAYMLVCAGETDDPKKNIMVVLINLDTGNRWREPVNMCSMTSYRDGYTPKEIMKTIILDSDMAMIVGIHDSVKDYVTSRLIKIL